ERRAHARDETAGGDLQKVVAGDVSGDRLRQRSPLGGLERAGPSPPRRVPDMQNFDGIVAHPIKYLVAIPNDKQDPYLGIVRPVPAMGLITQLRDSSMDACCNISRSAFGTLFQ